MINLDDSRVSFEGVVCQHDNQFSDVLIDKKYAFRELAIFPHNWLQKNRVEYEFLYNGVEKYTWEKLAEKVELPKEKYKIWENQYGEGYWFTVFEDLASAVAIYDLIKESPDYR